MKKLSVILLSLIFISSCAENDILSRKNITTPIKKQEEVKALEKLEPNENQVIFQGKVFNQGDPVPDNLIKNEIYDSFILNKAYVYEIAPNILSNKFSSDFSQIITQKDIFSLKAIEKTSDFITFEITEYDSLYRQKENLKPYIKTIKISDEKSNVMLDVLGLSPNPIFQNIKPKDLDLKSQLTYVLLRTQKMVNANFLKNYLKFYTSKEFSFSGRVEAYSLEIAVKGNISTMLEQGINLMLDFEVPILNEKHSYRFYRNKDGETIIFGANKDDNIDSVPVEKIKKTEL